MKYLIKPALSSKTAEHLNCEYCTEVYGCLGFCGTKCPLNQYKCLKPAVPGSSPTGVGDEE